ncbi:virulence factor effector protein [Duffyella gerundensis]|uniref:virulence factor SrfC family protein n=1 Tax=Duffyella gerundensis TaxID=1619313 RepID=UPI0016ACDB66|nr:virulence factor SrfC family protein [Duffyella gerundensis]UCB31023.1 virulence factor effector protein [Duffyella gerundensis]
MKVVTPKQQTTQLTKQLTALNNGIAAALEWIEQTRDRTPRLDLEADGLALRLRRHRRQLHGMANSLARDNSLALYGHSQPGKAWLLKEMVADAQGHLVTTLGGKQLEWFSHINPGHQDYGVVTRFSHTAEVKSAAWPVTISLFNEGEVTRMMLAAWRQQPGTPPTSQAIDNALSQLQRHRQSEPVAGLDSDELVALWQWSARHDAQHNALFDRHFWPQALELAPWLSVDDRARLFALLWAEDDTLTEAWRQLVHQLHQWKLATRVMAPLSLLVDESQLPAELLINPQAADGFGQSQDRQLEICPMNGNRMGKPQPVALATLLLLSRELLIPLDTPPRQAIFDQADMLDIPAWGEPEDEDTRFERRRSQQRNPLAARLMAARRALFLSSYAERRAIDLILVCNAASERADAATAGKLLGDWASQQPAAEKPRLLWSITRHDARHRQQHSVDEAVQRRVGQPGSDWGTMLVEDRAGVDRMASWLEAEIRPETSRQQLAEQLTALQQEIAETLFANWLQADATPQQAEQKQQIANRLLKALQHRTGLHGELLERLQPSREALRQLWLQPERQHVAAAAGPQQQHFGIGFEFDLFNDAPVTTPSQPGRDAADDESQFARQVQRFWLQHLRALPDSSSLLSLLDVDKTTLTQLIEELIDASFRLDIAGALQRALSEHELPGGNREAKADRQVSRALTVLGDFVAWLGFSQLPEAQRPASRVNPGQPIFARPPGPSVTFGQASRLTKLSATPANNTAFYIYDWLVGLDRLIVDNNGYASGRELDAAARNALADIVRQFAPVKRF